MKHLTTLVKLAELEGLTHMREAMQFAATICAADTTEMEQLRREVREAGVTGSDSLSSVRELLSKQKVH